MNRREEFEKMILEMPMNHDIREVDSAFVLEGFHFLLEKLLMDFRLAGRGESESESIWFAIRCGNSDSAARLILQLDQRQHSSKMISAPNQIACLVSGNSPKMILRREIIAPWLSDLFHISLQLGCRLEGYGFLPP